MAVVSFEGLHKSYGRRIAVSDVSFDVADREVVGLLGPNGSGKTTILRIVTGYLRASAGTVRVAGRDVHDGAAARRHIGYVPEDSPLYAHMRVGEYLAFAGRLRGLAGRDLDRRVAAASERLALGPVRETIIGRLSRGYRQRVSLAQAVLHEPRLLVLDEPTNGLDPRQIIEFRGLVRDLARDCAVLLTSHILGEIERIADRVVILLNGRLLGTHPIARAGRALQLRLRGPADAAPRIAAVLAATDGVTRLGEDGTGWRVAAADSAAAERLGVGLAAAGLAVVEVAETPSDLEEVFLRLTGGEAAR
ncbi:MAG: ABC transporter ATP-binding protein [Alphaproteobacteria bacterium]|nr:ABC transporter ATP-binding protein [Alphaproteobacteria bacterium]